jgi:hypothetical protein
VSEWRVAPGDPAYVFFPGVAKPINCGSRVRARLIVAAPKLLAALKPFAETPTTSETPGVARDDEADALIYAARAAIAEAEFS